MIGIPEAANIRIPCEDNPERKELSLRQLDFPLEVEAGGAMSSQGLGGVEEDFPVDGNRPFVSLTVLNETMKVESRSTCGTAFSRIFTGGFPG